MRLKKTANYIFFNIKVVQLKVSDIFFLRQCYGEYESVIGSLETSGSKYGFDNDQFNYSRSH